MNKFLVSALLLSAVLANTTITTSSFCNCGQFAYQADCTSSGLQCTWNNGCSETPCDKVDVATCLYIPRCMVSAGACTSFTSCAKLTGASAIACATQSIYCTWTAGANCTNVTAQNCADVPVADCGVNQFSATDGVCYVTGGKCAVLPNCGTLTTAATCSPATTDNACTWNATAATPVCVANSCAAQTTQGACLSYPTQTTNLNTVQLCTWGTACANGDTSTFTAANCVANTYGTYRWSSNNAADGNCSQCQYAGMLSAILFGFLVLLA